MIQRLLHITLFCVVLLPAWATPQGQSASEQVLLEEVRGLIQEEQPLQALRKLNQITDNPSSFSDRTRADAHYQKGKLYDREDSPEYALRQYNEALALYTQLGSVDGLQKTHLELGMLHANAHQDTQALEHFRSALDYLGEANPSPVVPELQMMVGELYKRQGNLPQAQSYLEEAMAAFKIDANQTSWNACALHLLSLYREQQTYNLGATLALEGYRTNTANDRLADAYAFTTELSRFRELTGKSDEAIHAQQQAVNLAVMQGLPDQWRAHLRLANLLATWDRDKEATAAYAAAMEYALAESNILSQQEVSRNIADFYHERGKDKSAYAYLSFSDSLQLVINAQAENARLQRTDMVELSQPIALPPAVEVAWYQRTGYLLVLLGVILAAGGVTNWQVRKARKQKQLLNWKLFRRTRELRQAQEDLNHYIYRSSHDLRNPLVSIQGLLRLLRAEDHSMNARKCLSMIETSVGQMDNILVNLSKALDYRKREVKVEKVNLRALRDELEGSTIQEPGGVEIIWDIKETAPFYSDPGLIKVILQNTIDNAIQFRGGSGDDYCRVTLSTSDKGATIHVEDNGIGIADQVQESVFGMFVKGSTQAKGTGLGLYMVRLACEKIRAKVDLRSEEQEGSTLSFTLPNLVSQGSGELA